MLATAPVPDAAPTPFADREQVLRDVLEGLSRPMKKLPGKYLWDETGSDLFDRICGTEDYYLTRRETALLEAAAGDIAGIVGAGATLVEYGSGASRKVRLLLDAMAAPHRYVAIDISDEYLAAATRRIAADYPGVDVLPVVADYTKPIVLPDTIEDGPVLGFFPGSTIGNFDEAGVVAFLERAQATIGQGWLLIGHDPNQDEASLKRAYGEADGLMGRLHLNMLAHINTRLGADFDLAAFRHTVEVRRDPPRVEAYLVATQGRDLSGRRSGGGFRGGRAGAHRQRLQDEPRDLPQPRGAGRLGAGPGLARSAGPVRPASAPGVRSLSSPAAGERVESPAGRDLGEGAPYGGALPESPPHPRFTSFRLLRLPVPQAKPSPRQRGEEIPRYAAVGAPLFCGSVGAPMAFASRRAGMEDPFGVAVRLHAALEDEVAGGVPGWPREIGGHGPVERIARILPVHHRAMRFKVSITCCSVTTPWCSQLAMCWLEMRSVGAVFHQPHIVDVRHLGAADALVDPAHHVAQIPWQLLSSSCATASGAQFDCATGIVRMSASFARRWPFNSA
jgi:dimethylhistidine N-methyltransferase